MASAKSLGMFALHLRDCVRPQCLLFYFIFSRGGKKMSEEMDMPGVRNHSRRVNANCNNKYDVDRGVRKISGGNKQYATSISVFQCSQSNV